MLGPTKVLILFQYEQYTMYISNLDGIAPRSREIDNKKIKYWGNHNLMIYLGSVVKWINLSVYLIFYIKTK